MSKRDVRFVRNLMDRITTSRARISAIDWRMKNTRLGVVYAGSGIRRQLSGDWALIKVDSAGRVVFRAECNMGCTIPRVVKMMQGK
jgi:hypothetical protein